MIVLITGQPGSGKTALAVDMLAFDPQFQERNKVVLGVPNLIIDHDVAPPVEEWTEQRQSDEDPDLKLSYFTFAPGSVVLIDEAQRVFRPRGSASSVPAHVAAFETHRHTGVDFILITQHVGLLDSNIRKLVGRHIHIKVTPLGRKKYEWSELGDPESITSRQIAARTNYALPKRSFSLYKSAEQHTKIKAALPGYVYIVIFSVLALVAGAVFMLSRWSGDKKDQKSDPAVIRHESSLKKAGEVVTTAAYLQSREPRIDGLIHTAPVYDDLAKPKQVPHIVGCIKTAKSCRCYTQQETIYSTTDAICSQFMAGAMFNDFLEPRQPPAQSEQPDKKPDHPRAVAGPPAIQNPVL